MADFKYAYHYLHKLEGSHKNLGYVNVETDYGGETIGGRTRKWKATKGKLPTDIEIWKHVDQLKKESSFPDNIAGHLPLSVLIVKAYERDEWKDIHGDDIPVQAVADEVLEFAVHKDFHTSVKMLQHCMSKLNYNGNLFADLLEDGFFGTVTADALKILDRRPGDIETLLNMFNCEQGHYYIERFTKSPSQEVNARGFFRRVEIRKHSVSG